MLLHSPDFEVRMRVYSALADLGPSAAPAVQDLIEATSYSREDRGSAADVLSKIGPAAASAVPALTRMLGDEWYGNRAVAAQALGNIGSAAVPAVPALMRLLLTDEDDLTRACSARALGQIGDSIALETLERSLREDRDTGVRAAAALALSGLGSSGRRSVPILSASLSDSEISVRVASALAIAKIAGESFPEVALAERGAYTTGADGEAIIVTAARQWWNTKGRYVQWDETTP